MNRDLDGSAIPQVSVVLPVFNEEAGLAELYRRVKAVLTGAHLSHEVIFVNDGSRDRSWERILGLANEDRCVKAVNFSRNFRIRERVTFTIRAEWQNAFNRLRLPQPTTTGFTSNPTQVNGIYTGGFGTVIPTAGNGVSGMRTGQLIGRLQF